MSCARPLALRFQIEGMTQETCVRSEDAFVVRSGIASEVRLGMTTHLGLINRRLLQAREDLD
jgi:hypothetical protein